MLSILQYQGQKNYVARSSQFFSSGNNSLSYTTKYSLIRKLLGNPLPLQMAILIYSFIKCTPKLFSNISAGTKP